MKEISRSPNLPFADYPFMFGGHELPPHLENAHAYNKLFAQGVMLPEQKGYTPTEQDALAIETCATVLTSVDDRLGRNTGGLGTMCGDNMEGLWDTLPTFYHNGDGTRLAVLSTRTYMEYINSLEGDRSPYQDREVYIETLLAAACDDVVFGAVGRGGDEALSRLLARTYLFLQGFSLRSVRAVDLSVDASVFNEKTFRQQYAPKRGAAVQQRGSLVGDGLHSASPVGTLTLVPLLTENIWKRDTAHLHGQILMHTARKAAQKGWRGNSLEDFLDLAQRNPEVVRHYSDEFIRNPNFLLKENPYADPRINNLVRPGLEQNAVLQPLIGQALGNAITAEDIFADDPVLAGASLTLSEAVHVAASYAEADKWLAGQRNSAALGPLTPDDISRILLTPRSIESMQHPIDAEWFFRAYMREKMSTGR